MNRTRCRPANLSIYLWSTDWQRHSNAKFSTLDRWLVIWSEDLVLCFLMFKQQRINFSILHLTTNSRKRLEGLHPSIHPPVPSHPISGISAWPWQIMVFVYMINTNHTCRSLCVAMYVRDISHAQTDIEGIFMHRCLEKKKREIDWMQPSALRPWPSRVRMIRGLVLFLTAAWCYACPHLHCSFFFLFLMKTLLVELHGKTYDYFVFRHMYTDLL